MLGPQRRRQAKLFYQFDLDSMIPPDHLLRRIDALVDFSHARKLTAHLYGSRGNPSEDPAVTLKLLLLLFLHNVPSQRELMRQMPLRLDWLWFCGFDLDQTDQLPDHRVLTKARGRWGEALFQQLFEDVVRQCVDAGMVANHDVYLDASVNAADASMNSLKTHLRLVLDRIKLDADEQTDPAVSSGDSTAANQSSIPMDSASPHAAHDVSAQADSSDGHADSTRRASDPMLGKPLSTTDPDARLTRKNGQTILGYKDHRVIDGKCGIITATLVTPADIDDGAMLVLTLDAHQRLLQDAPQVLVADKGYGHADNYQHLIDQQITPCIPHKRVREDPTKLRRRLFVYNNVEDCYTCPAGRRLTRRGGRYRADTGVCEGCGLRDQCTDDRVHGRQLRRHPRQWAIDHADAAMSKSSRAYFMGRRKAVAEGSFADATNNHGYKRHCWRGLGNARVRDLLIATSQNLRKLSRRPSGRSQPSQTSSRHRPIHLSPHPRV